MTISSTMCPVTSLHPNQTDDVDTMKAACNDHEFSMAKEEVKNTGLTFKKFQGNGSKIYDSPLQLAPAEEIVKVFNYARFLYINI
jgi:hypothetical protein